MTGIATDPIYLDLSMPPHASFNRLIDPGHTAFTYVFEGKARFQNEDTSDTIDLVGNPSGHVRHDVKIEGAHVSSCPRPRCSLINQQSNQGRNDHGNRTLRWVRH